MSLFKPAEEKPSFLKMGIYGPPKSGKSYTSTLIAKDLHKEIKSTKPVAYFDTEGGSDYLLGTYKAAGIELLVVKSRSFSDLMEAVREATQTADILIVDSVTHVWKELMDAYKKKRGIDYVQFDDWAIIKKEWEAFTTLFLNCHLHMVVCGRAQDVWEETVNEKGRKEKSVVGSRMATEKNLAYEPSLLVEMERIADPKTGFLTPRAWILGDRFPETGLSGKCFDNPAYETFRPHIERLNLGGNPAGVDVTRSSENLFTPGSSDSRYEYQKQRDIALEEIKDEVDRRWSGMSVEQKNARIDVLVAVFGTSSKTAIENLSVNVLREGLKRIRSGEFDQAGKADEPVDQNGAHKTPSKKKAA
jgi:hypothetical protein